MVLSGNQARLSLALIQALQQRINSVRVERFSLEVATELQPLAVSQQIAVAANGRGPLQIHRQAERAMGFRAALQAAAAQPASLLGPAHRTLGALVGVWAVLIGSCLHPERHRQALLARPFGHGCPSENHGFADAGSRQARLSDLERKFRISATEQSTFGLLHQQRSLLFAPACAALQELRQLR